MEKGNEETVDSNNSRWKPDSSHLSPEWKLERLKHVSQVNPSGVDKKSNDDELEVELCNYTEVYNNEFIDHSFDFLSATATEREIHRFELREGDILFTKDSEDWEDIGVPAFVSEDLPGVLCGYHLFLSRPDEEVVFPEFLFWALNSRYVAFQFEGAATGVTRYGLTTRDVANAWIPYPPKPIQKIIVSYLNYQTRKIDRLYNQSEKLIQYLNERYSALITKSISNSQYRNSHTFGEDVGMSVNSDQPKIRHISKSVTSGPRSWAQYYNESSEAKFLRITNLQDNEIQLDLDDLKYVSPPNDSEAKRSRVQPGDILVSITANIGAVGIVPSDIGEAYVNQHIAVIRPPKSVLSKWIAYYLASHRGQYQLLQPVRGGTKDGLGLADVGNVRVPFPSISTQRSIVQNLDKERKRLEKLSSELESLLERLDEQRRALITKAVTGQIDLSDWQPPDKQETFA
ncbi:restriction endonuclease subunit S [Natrinema sp. H-ect4]|uniref:restriction endonuclease subunit S n=1 Tax=Natrinema sp. H-ect4 TaxID=3242699 RepID=UPI0035A85C0F